MLFAVAGRAGRAGRGWQGWQGCGKGYIYQPPPPFTIYIPDVSSGHTHIYKYICARKVDRGVMDGKGK